LPLRRPGATKAILTLLCRTGQRIGDWSDVNGRHGILGMTLSDVDEQEQTITVRLKGAREDHRVPVTADFWPLFSGEPLAVNALDGATLASMAVAPEVPVHTPGDVPLSPRAALSITSAADSRSARADNRCLHLYRIYCI
jgi:hypothetical protein